MNDQPSWNPAPPIDPALTAKRHAIVLEHMAAENAYEFKRCMDAFAHPRYEIIPTGEVWDDYEGVGDLLDQNKTGFPDFHFGPTTFHHSESAVLVEGRFTGTHLGTWRGVPASGRRVDLPLIIVFMFEDDRMVCERTYFDVLTVLTQLGAVPGAAPAG